MKKLQEKTINLKELYKKYFHLTPFILAYGDGCFQNLEDAIELVERAQKKAKGRRNAKASEEEEASFLYMYKVAFKMAAYYFWVFLGPNNKSRQIRIENEGFYDYAGLCNEAMYRALQVFDPHKAKSVSALKSGFQFYFKGYIEFETKKYNREYNSHGITGWGTKGNAKDENGEDDTPDFQIVNPDSMNVDGNKSAWDSVGYTSDEDTLGVSDFFRGWKKLAGDPELHGKKPWGEMLASILQGDSVEDVAKEFDISKNTIREKFFSTKHNRENGSNGLLADLMDKYGLETADLATAMKNELGKVLNILKRG